MLKFQLLFVFVCFVLAAAYIAIDTHWNLGWH
jgi:hypothetical protein